MQPGGDLKDGKRLWTQAVPLLKGDIVGKPQLSLSRGGKPQALTQGQEIAAQNFYRPRNPDIAAKYSAQFPTLKLVTIDDAFGGWAKAQKKHFADGGSFDQIYEKK